MKGIISVDFIDLSFVLKKSGLGTVSIVTGKGKNKVVEVTQEVLNKPLFDGNILNETAGLLIHIKVDTKTSFNEVKHIFEEIQKKFNDRCNIIYSFIPSEEFNNEIRVTLILTGCPHLNKTKKKISEVMKLKNILN